MNASPALPRWATIEAPLSGANVKNSITPKLIHQRSRQHAICDQLGRAAGSMLENIALASAAYSAEYSTQGEGIDKAHDKARDKEYNTRRFRGNRLTRTGDYAEREITSRENSHDRKNLCRELCRELCRSITMLNKVGICAVCRSRYRFRYRRRNHA